MVSDEKIANAILGLIKLKRNKKEKGLNSFRKKSTYAQMFLLEIFNECQYPSMETIEDIAMLLHFPAKNIQIWFQNKRNSTKKIQPNVLYSYSDLYFKKEIIEHKAPVKVEPYDLSSRALLLLFQKFF
ncbi:MAG: homeobox domain-containing protein [Rickettsia endosymbiont of Ixodes persulcatus]|nr:homeobox domain-containing protein [Rickettsia endosymbiont of Ixodes persulcatus]